MAKTLSARVRSQGQCARSGLLACPDIWAMCRMAATASVRLKGSASARVPQQLSASTRRTTARSIAVACHNVSCAPARGSGSPRPSFYIALPLPHALPHDTLYALPSMRDAFARRHAYRGLSGASRRNKGQLRVLRCFALAPCHATQSCRSRRPCI